jgi:hypothetical protein
MWWKYTPSGLKGLYNLSANNSGWAWDGGPTDAITIIDSCPFCTLAVKGNRAPWSLGDTAIGIDQPTSGLAFRDPYSITGYINNYANGGPWLERLTASLKAFIPPTTVYNALNVTSITTAPTNQSYGTNTAAGTLPATTTTYYVVQGFNAEGHTVLSTEVNITTGSGSVNRNYFYNTFPAGVTYYNWYKGASTGTETGPCNAAPIPYTSGSVETIDSATACPNTGSLTAPTNTNTMPAASVTVTGPVIATSATAAVGYGTGGGAGCAITQITSRTTGVTCTGNTGAITLYTAAGSATAATFTVTDTSVAATDTIQCSEKSGTNLYLCSATNVTAGTFNITFFTTGGTSSDAPVLNFTVIKGSAN